MRSKLLVVLSVVSLVLLSGCEHVLVLHHGDGPMQGPISFSGGRIEGPQMYNESNSPGYIQVKRTGTSPVRANVSFYMQSDNGMAGIRYAVYNCENICIYKYGGAKTGIKVDTLGHLVYPSVVSFENDDNGKPAVLDFSHGPKLRLEVVAIKKGGEEKSVSCLYQEQPYDLLLGDGR